MAGDVNLETDCSIYTFDFDSNDQPLVESLVNNAEYVGKKLTTDVRVPGRLGDP